MSTSSDRIVWAKVRERYVVSHHDGPTFATLEGIDYGRLRWHVAHGHWRKAQKEFEDRELALAMDLALTGRAAPGLRDDAYRRS